MNMMTILYVLGFALACGVGLILWPGASWQMRTALALGGAIIILSIATTAHAQSVYPVQPLQDYRCMRLAPPGVSPASMDWTRLRTRLEPRLDATPGLMPQSVAFVRWPEVQRNGFAEVIQVNRTPAWVPVSWLQPWSGRGRCVPSVMNTGLVGVG